jgi:hypothetical protein
VGRETHMDITRINPHTNTLYKSSSFMSLKIQKQKQRNICHKLLSISHQFNVPTKRYVTPLPMFENKNMPLNQYLKNSVPNNKYLPNQLHNIPVETSTHPLESSITNLHIQAIISTYELATSSPDTNISSINKHPVHHLPHSHFRELLTYGSPVKDSVLHSFLLL